MPTSLVKTPRDERLWQKAKDIADEAGHAENWAYVMGVYKKMNPDRFDKSAARSTSNASSFEKKSQRRCSALFPLLARPVKWGRWFTNCSPSLVGRSSLTTCPTESRSPLFGRPPAQQVSCLEGSR